MKKHFLFFLLMISTMVAKAAEDYEEIGYEDLVRQIGAQKRGLESSRQTHPFDEVRIHSGVGYVNSFSQMQINSRNVQRYQNGIQLALGVDLFSKNWFAETSFRNFGLTTYGSEELLLKELDLKLGYKDDIRPNLGFRLQGGLANRYLKINDGSNGVNVDDTTPMMTGSAGIIGQINQYLGFGFDVSGKSALISRTADKSAIDFTLELRASL